jgi:hypothetical protein
MGFAWVPEGQDRFSTGGRGCMGDAEDLPHIAHAHVQ